ncbi:hypothetical protein [Bordetella tumulicola]
MGKILYIIYAAIVVLSMTVGSGVGGSRGWGGSSSSSGWSSGGHK